ncbi:MAG TPA: MFS transporter [Coleofasciculaceae cyanobacterium]
MVTKTVDRILEDTKPRPDLDISNLPVLEVSENSVLSEAIVPTPPLIISKETVRTSLRASIWDGVFATMFGSITAGVLLTNFLLELGATSVEIGLLSSIPMFVNLLQPLGAYLADRTTSRHWYGMCVFGLSRFLWVILLLLIAWIGDTPSGHHQLVMYTLGIVLATHVLGSLGSASWFSWMAALVPRRLRGRYFGLRNSAANLMHLVCVPLMGWGISAWKGGAIQGYSIVLFLGIIAGLFSLVFQFFIVDVNPQSPLPVCKSAVSRESTEPASKWYKDANFLTFLLYFSMWTFAVNLSAPFFTLYMLDDLHIDVSWVTLLNSLTSGANLLMLVMWGKLADRFGNRPILILVGILVAMMPLFWLAAGTHANFLWIGLLLVHLLSGGSWAALDLCSNNIQIGVAPARSQASYFAIAAAIAGVTGALGTTTGGFLAQFASTGGLPGLFVLSAVLRLVALLPLMFVREHRSASLVELWGEAKRSLSDSLSLLRKNLLLLPTKPQAMLIQAVGLANRFK